MIDKLREKYRGIEGERFFAELFEREEYKKALDVPAHVVLDIGACAGEFAAYIYDKADIIYAIEPYSEHFAELTQNVDEFHLDKIKPFRLALAGSRGNRILSLGGRGGHKIMPEGEGTGEEVPTMTLAQFMNEMKIERVNVLKIDVEDGEKEIFGADDFPSVADRIDFIIGEHLPQVAPRLESLGFKLVDEFARNFSYQR